MKEVDSMTATTNIFEQQQKATFKTAWSSMANRISTLQPPSMYFFDSLYVLQDDVKKHRPEDHIEGQLTVYVPEIIS